MSFNQDDMYSCEYTFTEEELNQIEEISNQYDEMVQDELEQNPIEIGYCGFICDGKCYDCIGSGTYNTADEV
jgi:hypothetical protein